MLKVLIPFILVVVMSKQQNDPASKQLVEFKNQTKGPIGILTNSAGAPVEYREAKSTLNTQLLDNEHLMDLLTHVVRERIPDRVVHASGTGAFGYFETTHDISHICKAKLFTLGKRTRVAVRFSLGFSSRGVRDTNRDLRGFAIKFYTEDGNFDIVGFNTPVFSFKDPLLFAPLSHVFRRNPVTNLPDPNMLWDYIIHQPESIFSFLYFFSDLAMPDGYRHMPGFSIHTYQIYNEDGESSFVRFHFSPLAGIKNFNNTEAAKIAIGDPDYFGRDLYNAIANGNCPTWEMKMQIMSHKDVEKAGIDIFDVTKEVPIEQFPLIPVGNLTLNKNPTNHFAEMEQLAFCPGNLVPGVRGGCDAIFRARTFSYRDAQLYRLGDNFKKIPVNCPMKAFTYSRDGVPPVGDNGKDAPNYYPNSFNGPIPTVDKNRPPLCRIHEEEPNNFEQAGNFYSNVLNSEQKSSLVDNIVDSLCSCEKFIKKQAIHWFTIIHSNLGERVAKALEAKCQS